MPRRTISFIRILGLLIGFAAPAIALTIKIRTKTVVLSLFVFLTSQFPYSPVFQTKQIISIDTLDLPRVFGRIEDLLRLFAAVISFDHRAHDRFSLSAQGHDLSPSIA